MITLRDMGLKSKVLIAACTEHGVKMNKERASRIINGTTLIKPEEMEVISKILSKTVDELYTQLGSALEVDCPFFSIGRSEFIPCRRQRCALWDWEMLCCGLKVQK